MTCRPTEEMLEVIRGGMNGSRALFWVLHRRSDFSHDVSCLRLTDSMDLNSILFLSAILMMEQKVFTASTVPVSQARRASPSQLGSKPPYREKRCSCENLKDRECVYFCHIGIVWVNTP
ncbi:hypothetical protein QTP70_031221, partial [Hemibagrus guttatus]